MSSFEINSEFSPSTIVFIHTEMKQSQIYNLKNHIRNNGESVFNVSKKSGFPESTARKIAFAPHINIGVFSLEKNSSCWKSWQDILRKALSSGKVFGSEGLAMNIAVYDKNVDVEFLPLYCNWIASNVLPKYDQDNKNV